VPSRVSGHALHELLRALFGRPRIGGPARAHEPLDDPLDDPRRPPLRERLEDADRPRLDDDEERLRLEVLRPLEALRRLGDDARAPLVDAAVSSPRTPRATPRAAPTTTSPARRAPATPMTAPRRIVSRVRGEKIAAVAAATKADSLLIRSSSPTTSSSG
jgi:hypothetical protein